MSSYIGALGKGLGKIWEDSNWMDHVLMGSALPGAFEYGAQRIVTEHKEAFDYGLAATEAEEKAAKDEQIAANDRLNALFNKPAPTQPTYEMPTYEPPAIPQWLPPTTLAPPPAEHKAPTYTPRRTTTVLTSKGDVQTPSKGKKTLLGE